MQIKKELNYWKNVLFSHGCFFRELLLLRWSSKFQLFHKLRDAPPICVIDEDDLVNSGTGRRFDPEENGDRDVLSQQRLRHRTSHKNQLTSHSHQNFLNEHEKDGTYTHFENEVT